jgi:ubiquinone/menaquinone biosynthesis C-methylase UbiE
MTDSEIRGATVEFRPEAQPTPEGFDLVHEMTAQSELIWKLSAQAYGADYPAEVRPFGMTTWWVLGRFVSELRVGPGQQLVDLACGRGGPGLWLARATGANLIGVDWARAAVESARSRARDFVPDGRARFEVGDLTATGLPDDSADAVTCVDAIFFAVDRIAAFAEVARILRPGGRFVFTADEDDSDRRSGVPDWSPIALAGGMVIERKEEVPRFAEQLQRMYSLWLDNLDALRAELGEEAARDLEDEANTVGPTLRNRTALIMTARLRDQQA